jgi:metallo-beta-lactamase family protein
MKIHFNGAAQTVTGSQCLLEVNQHLLLLECGLFQGKRFEIYERNQNFQFNINRLGAVILSHTHIDHSGNIPTLVKKGYSGPIYATLPTTRLADIMLQDSGHVQEENVNYANYKRAKRGEPPMEPLYTAADGAQVAQYLVPVHYNQTFEPVPGVTAHLVDAGHLLGSAAIVLDIVENGRKFRLWYSGDIGRKDKPILCDPVVPEAADYLIMECTYGDKSHRDPHAAYEEFRDVVNQTVNRGGKIVIPSFAVGRTQELVYDLNQMMVRGEVPRVPVYVDSPLAVHASRIFQDMEESPEFLSYYDQDMLKFMDNGRREAFSFANLTYIQSVEESKKLNERKDPLIIISAAGMAETGRIQHHIRWAIEDKKNTIVIVSWQAPDTLGRRLADREKHIKIFGEVYFRRAEIATIGGLSAHAGQDFLLEYATASQAQLKQIFLIHGEPPIAKVFQQKLAESCSTPVAFPEFGSTVEI